MATVIGESGAWCEIASRLARRGLTVARPEDLEPLRGRLTEARPASIAAHRNWTLRQVASKSAEKTQLLAGAGALSRFFKRPRVFLIDREIRALYQGDSAYPRLLDSDIAAVAAVVNSAEVAGASAELEVIERLRGLPDDYVVLNDVQLASKHFMRDAHGVPLMSAQLDHVVIGPPGVFVIETKCWSRESAQRSDFHDPFDQVRRASRLCWVLLKESMGTVPVHETLVPLGSLPTTSDRGHVSVVRIEGLCRHIQEWRGETFEPARVERAVSFLSSRVGHKAPPVASDVRPRHATPLHIAPDFSATAPKPRLAAPLYAFYVAAALLLFLAGCCGSVQILGMLSWQASASATTSPLVAGVVDIPRARAALQAADPAMAKALVNPNTPATQIDGPLVTYTWQYLRQSSPSQVNVEDISITLNSAGNIIGAQ